MPTPTDISELRAKAATPQAQDPKQRVRRTWLIKSLLDLIATSPDQLVEKATVLLSAILAGKKRTLSASHATVEEVVSIFELEQLREPMNLPSTLHDIPDLLNQNLANLDKAFYDDRSEASCRIAVDYMIVAAKLLLNELHPPPTRSTKRLRTSQLSTSPPHPQPQQLRVFPELELEITIPDQHSNPVQVTGRADWALGYKGRTATPDGAVLVVIEAKRRDQFGAAEAQLLTYLAVLRQLRINTEKENCIAQGCYTDGERYVFMCIDNDGRIAVSNVYDIRGQEQRKVVFNYIVTVLETAVRTSPTTCPVKKDRSADVTDVGRNIYQKIFRLGGSEILSESDDEDGILLEIEDG